MLSNITREPTVDVPGNAGYASRHGKGVGLRLQPADVDTVRYVNWRVVVLGLLIVSGASCSADDRSSPAASSAPADGCPNTDPNAGALFDGLLPRSITLDGQTYERPTVEVVASQQDADGVLYIVGNIRSADGTTIIAGGEWAFDGVLLALNDGAFDHSAALEGRTVLTGPGQGASSPTLQELRRCAADSSDD